MISFLKKIRIAHNVTWIKWDYFVVNGAEILSLPPIKKTLMFGVTSANGQNIYQSGKHKTVAC